MTYVGWRFPPLSGGTRQGYTNNDIEVFKGHELIDNLAREICQNSLDAGIDNSHDPVRVVFELRKFEINRYDVFSQYKNCISGCRNYWGNEMDDRLSRFLSGAEKALGKETISVLTASDSNTKGLIGCRTRNLSSPWEALTGSDGVSVKNDSNSAGSYGIGKNAPFACSDLSMVFYNTLTEDNESAFIGVSRLATLLNQDGKPTQRVGKYQINDEENEIWTPIYPDTENEFRDCFKRTEYGTDVIIVGFNQENNWVTSVTKAVLKNFFVAISEGSLVVELKDDNKNVLINAGSLAQLFADYSSDSEMIATSQLYAAFVSPDCSETLDVEGEEKAVEVYIKADSSYKRTIANFRATGMLVGTYYKRIFQHYAAVVIVRGKNLGELLKDTEPPRHNRWDYKQIEVSNREKRNKAKRCIQIIEEYVLELLKNQFEVTAEDTVDAAGVGEYLPDDVDGFEGQADGNDPLKVKVKIGKADNTSKQRNKKTTTGKEAEGVVQEGDVHNHVVNPNPPSPKPPRPNPVIPGPGKKENVKGFVEGPGIKSIRTVNMETQRAFPVSASQGLYKIVILPSESHENLYMACSAIGEKGNPDKLTMENVFYNKNSVKISDGKAGPLKVTANTPSVFYVRFLNKEKMKLRLSFTEE